MTGQGQASTVQSWVRSHICMYRTLPPLDIGLVVEPPTLECGPPPCDPIPSIIGVVTPTTLQALLPLDGIHDQGLDVEPPTLTPSFSIRVAPVITPLMLQPWPVLSSIMRRRSLLTLEPIAACSGTLSGFSSLSVTSSIPVKSFLSDPNKVPSPLKSCIKTSSPVRSDDSEEYHRSISWDSDFPWNDLLSPQRRPIRHRSQIVAFQMAAEWCASTHALVPGAPVVSGPLEWLASTSLQSHDEPCIMNNKHV